MLGLFQMGMPGSGVLQNPNRTYHLIANRNFPEYEFSGWVATVGLVFKSSVGGKILGINFYRGAEDDENHQLDFWTVAGVNLGHLVTSGIIKGWNTLCFSAPITILPNQTYIVSDFGNGYVTCDDFSPTHTEYNIITSGPLSTVSDQATGITAYTYFMDGYGCPIPVNGDVTSTNLFYVDIIFMPS